mmetsp:Transcript_19246/g.44570  ORF Transcript_19246/g.44570 Transcript_19246/m.44570 type:complete len:308 (+) Transcript_19246:42-965(+)|eukprot:CAMPEP_0172385456 /NCGR_PEP_ID=MMETSP1061-20121228/3128_1 /TAXON_ID=37318 /ORGANISM="Pseudo-nitzschia pungens, Strain cf. pungens" /LENGTH=307 /DNA_ID=CAMNT_0013114493 /DNA_START=313 /DNA_END=1236 /DNA_ORIENTATION=-
MTSLAVVQSSMPGVLFSGTTGVSAAAASSLALAVFRNKAGTTTTTTTKPESHAPNQKAIPRRNRRTAVKSKERNPTTTTATTPTTSSTISTSTISKTKAAAANAANAAQDLLLRLYRAWLLLPQIFRFFVAGNLGNLGFFYLEKIIFRCLSHLLIAYTEVCSFVLDTIARHQDGLAFFSAYVVQIVTTHLLYALLVYGLETIDTYEKYSKTLRGQFQVYGFGLFGATALNSALIGRGMHKTKAFWATTAAFAAINYVLVSRVVKNVVESSESSSSSEASSHAESSGPDAAAAATRSRARRPPRRSPR